MRSLIFATVGLLTIGLSTAQAQGFHRGGHGYRSGYYGVRTYRHSGYFGYRPPVVVPGYGFRPYGYAPRRYWYGNPYRYAPRPWRGFGYRW